MLSDKEPRPGCCSKANTEDPYRESWKLSAYISIYRENSKPEWIMAGESINFCPWCGKKLPELIKSETPPEPLCRVTDGGYYCDTCGERLHGCQCHPPWAAYEVKNERTQGS